MAAFDVIALTEAVAFQNPVSIYRGPKTVLRLSIAAVRIRMIELQPLLVATPDIVAGRATRERKCVKSLGFKRP